jgi:hypothetical protein
LGLFGLVWACLGLYELCGFVGDCVTLSLGDGG